jgi:hypothetical protein
MMLLDKSDKRLDRSLEHRDRVAQRLAVPLTAIGGCAMQHLIPQGIELQEHWYGWVQFVIGIPRCLDAPLSIANARPVPILPGFDVQKRRLEDSLHIGLEVRTPESICHLTTGEALNLPKEACEVSNLIAIDTMTVIN